MLDQATTAIVTGAAGNIVAYMLNGRADALRAWVSKIFRTGTELQPYIPLRALEKDRIALAQETATESEVKSRWIVLLSSLLATHPELREEIRTMASACDPTGTITVGSQHNHGSGTFIGGNNYGSINSASSRESE